MLTNNYSQLTSEIETFCVTMKMDKYIISILFRNDNFRKGQTKMRPRLMKYNKNTGPKQ